MKITESLEERNIENLYSFYINLGARSGYTAGRIGAARFITAKSRAWPSYILGGGKMVKGRLLEIFEGMREDRLPYFWVRPIKDDPEFEDFAELNGLRKINFWRGMNLSRDKIFGLFPPFPGVVFEELKTSDDIKSWLKVVNSEIMTTRELQLSNFVNVLDDPSFRFFRVARGKKTLSTIVMHEGSSVTGIYMVSTLLSERGKGLGRWITASAIDVYIAQGCKDFVLHSTPLGYPVYSKLGFIECCEFGIFWMLGKK